MSYEGYTEYLCDNGHYWTVRASDNDFEGLGRQSLFCTCCGAPYAFVSEVDLTNGSNPDIPHTFSAPKIEYGWEDIAKIDHWKNLYYEKLSLFLPDVRSRRWEVAMHNLSTPPDRRFQQHAFQ